LNSRRACLISAIFVPRSARRVRPRRWAREVLLALRLPRQRARRLARAAPRAVPLLGCARNAAGPESCRARYTCR
jgi:hypothetical protein